MRAIADLMTRGAFLIDAQQSLGEAARRMEHLRFRHLPVIEGSRLVGMLSLRDILTFENGHPGVDREKALVGDAMSRDPFTVGPDTKVAVVARAMVDRRVDAAIVVEGGRVVGVFTATDALATLVELDRTSVAPGDAWPRRVLCPVDFSAGSRAAVERAVDLARASGGMVTLLHVYDLPTGVGGEVILTAAAARDKVEREVEVALRSWEEEHRRPGGPQLAAVKALGGAVETIVQQARRGSFDLIVMGTHGRTGVKRLMLGSVAEAVVRRADCPVLTVRRRDEA